MHKDIRALLEAPPKPFTPAERKLVRVLLADFPMSGLTTVSQLAKRCGVSDPSVLRLVKKLGFSGYPEFQSALVQNIDERMRSPLSMLPKSRQGSAGGDKWDDFIDATIEKLSECRQLQVRQDTEQLLTWLSDPRKGICCHGGRFSGFLAGYLYNHLHLLRAGCSWIATPSQLPEQLIDLRPGDIFIQFDYRRYQKTAALATETARRRQAKIVLFTDIYDSPLRQLADIVIAAPVEVPSPFDSLVPAMAQVEALIAELTARLDSTMTTRVEEIDHIRQQFGSHLLQDDQ